MRIGSCAGLEQLETLRDAGFDYVEIHVGAVKPESPDSEYEPNRELIQSAEIVPEAWSILLPGDMKVVGPEIDIYRIERYMRTAFERIEHLGGEIVVFGSGAARSIPDGFPADEAWDQLIEFLTLAGQVAGAYGITIAVEHLNSGECNCINTVPQAAELAKAVDHPFVKVLIDLYHIMQDSEPLADINSAAGLIAHAHVADTDRLYPGSGSYPTREFIEALKSAGYDDRLSIECAWRDLDAECVKALDYLRGLDVY